ncbi:hypothetical protein KAH94_06755 [bacterium]|nr:hypothetical protein [bacterium]
MEESRPCQNKDCEGFDMCENCDDNQKQESAWKMFKQLEEKNCLMFHKLLYKKLFPKQEFIGKYDQYDMHCKLAGKLIFMPEQEAIDIMQSILKE